VFPANVATHPVKTTENGAELAQAVPVLVSTLPEVLGATNWTADVPLPITTLLAVRVVAPVPPFVTGRTPETPLASGITDTATNLKSEPFQATRAAVPLATVIPVVGPTPRITTAKPPVVLFITT
jgi:hypothetical protein